MIFAGAKPYPTLPAWYQASDIYVLPSWAEGLSLALLEAMASGVPVITTTPAHGDHDAVRPGETGLLFERGNPDQLAQLLLSLAADRVAAAGTRPGRTQAGGGRVHLGVHRPADAVGLR